VFKTVSLWITVSGVAWGVVVTAASVIFGKTFWNWVFPCSIAVTIFAGIYSCFLWKKGSKKASEDEMGGDKYNNFGNNFGHMGPINNYGKPEIEITEDIIRSVSSECPFGNDILIIATGRHKSVQLAEKLKAGLERLGHQVGLGTGGFISPPPKSHITIRQRSPQVQIIVTADV
jgi:hypothetical protein